MAEEALRELDRPTAPELRYLGEDDAPRGIEGDTHAAARMAERHSWLVDRMTGRIAAHWPAEIDAGWVRGHAMAALRRVAARVDSEDELPEAGVRAIRERLRTLLGGTEWYREAMLCRARPLCEAWRGAVLARREASDRALSARLRLPDATLTERFVELATLFAVEPAALLPGGCELSEGVALAVGGLPNDQRLVASLYFEQQLTLVEIARVMDLRPVRAQELLGRAAAAIAGEAALAEWPAVLMRA